MRTKLCTPKSIGLFFFQTLLIQFGCGQTQVFKSYISHLLTRSIESIKESKKEFQLGKTVKNSISCQRLALKFSLHRHRYISEDEKTLIIIKNKLQKHSTKDKTDCSG